MHKKITSESESQHCHLLEVVICVTPDNGNTIGSFIWPNSLRQSKLKMVEMQGTPWWRAGVRSHDVQEHTIFDMRASSHE